MSVKSQQVLRTKITLRAAGNVQIPAGTRVVVMGVKDGQVRVKVVDETQPQLTKVRTSGKESVFERTFRGRPKLEKSDTPKA